MDIQLFNLKQRIPSFIPIFLWTVEKRTSYVKILEKYKVLAMDIRNSSFKAIDLSLMLVMRNYV